MNRALIPFVVFVTSWALNASAVFLQAGDWPQILGPHRDGIADGEELASNWPQTGPKTVWERHVGSGFAGVAVVQGTAVLFHRVGGEEIVEGLNPATGKELWKTRFPTTYRGTISEDNGPRCTPLIHQDRVVLYVAQGDLRCLALTSGKELWTRHACKDYGADLGYFGAGSTPIVEGDKVLVNVGGDRQGAGLVAFSLADGKTVWKATNDQPSYSSPIAATVDGVRHVIFVTRLRVVSVDPETGKVRFEFPFGRRGPTVNAANPLVIDGNLFVTSNYGIGARFAKIGPTSVQTLWESDDIVSSQYVTCIYHNGHLFGVDGQDGPEVILRCFDPKTQKIAWTKDRFGTASLLLAGDKLLALKTTGELVLAEASVEKYAQLESASVLNSTTRAIPALSNGLLYVRDTTTLKCLAVGKSRN